jgi:hypothetical protein
MWNRASRRAKVTGGSRKDYVLVPCSMTMSPSDMYGALRIDCLTLLSSKTCDEKLGVQPEGGEVVGHGSLAGACSAQLSRFIFTFHRSRHHNMISLVPLREAPVTCWRG